MFTLSNIGPKKGAKKKRKRVGRGPGSGHGKTSTRGHKGQKARSGGGKGPGFEGGQMPLYRRLPKRGFKNPFRVEYEVVNLEQLEQKFADGDVVTLTVLKEKRLVRKNLPVKILARGELSKKLTVEAHAFSEKAKQAIESVGGTVRILPWKPQASGSPEPKTAEGQKPSGSPPEEPEPVTTQGTESEQPSEDESPEEAKPESEGES